MSRLSRFGSKIEGGNRANCNSSNQQFTHGTLLCSRDGVWVLSRLKTYALPNLLQSSRASLVKAIYAPMYEHLHLRSAPIPQSATKREESRKKIAVECVSKMSPTIDYGGPKICQRHWRETCESLSSARLWLRLQLD